MRIRSIRSGPFIVCILLWAAAATAQTPLGTAFTYQGRLTDGGTPISGSHDMEFRLFDSAAGATQIGPTLPVAGVPVALGLFTVALDFGPSAFAGDRRWLQIGVKTAGSGGPYTSLTPRQLLAPSPNAVYATTAGTALVEADPQVGATTNGQWCVGNGTQVSCTAAPPVLTESDPQVGALTAGRWCRANATALTVECTQGFPTVCAANQYMRGDGACFDIGPHRFSGSIAPGASATIGLGVVDLGQVVKVVFGDEITQQNYTIFDGLAQNGNTAIKGFTFETNRTTVGSLRLNTIDSTTNQYVAAHGFGILRGSGLQGSLVVFNNHATLNMFYVAIVGPSSSFPW